VLGAACWVLWCSVRVLGAGCFLVPVRVLGAGAGASVPVRVLGAGATASGLLSGPR